MAATRVKMSLGYTRNMGNFESLRVDVGIEVDVKDGENPGETFKHVSDKLKAELVQQVLEMEKELNG